MGNSSGIITANHKVEYSGGITPPPSYGTVRESQGIKNHGICPRDPPLMDPKSSRYIKSDGVETSIITNFTIDRNTGMSWDDKLFFE